MVRGDTESAEFKAGVRRRGRGDTNAVYNCFMEGYREDEMIVLESHSERMRGNDRKLQYNSS